MDEAGLGTVMIVMGTARVVAGPLWGLAADALRRDGALLAIGCGLTAVVGTAVVISPVALLLPLLVFHALLRAPLGTLLDAAAVRSLTSEGRPEAYGRLRLWGSIGYLVLAGLAGLLASSGLSLVLALAIATWAITALLATRLDIGDPSPPTNPLPAFVALLHTPRLALLLVAATLHGTALAAYDTLYAVHLTASGISAAWTGAAIGVGVLTEVVVLLKAPYLLRVLGPWTLVALSMAAGAIRWSATSSQDDAMTLTLIQASHGVVFGAYWIGMVEAARRLTPDVLRASVQALLVTTTYGVGAALCGLFAYEILPVGGTERLFEVCAMLSAAGAALTWIARPRVSFGPAAK